MCRRSYWNFPVASWLRTITTFPLFQIEGKFDDEPGRRSTFVLKPTWAFWLWIPIGCLIAFLPLLTGVLIQVVTLAISFGALRMASEKELQLNIQARACGRSINQPSATRYSKVTEQLAIWRPIAIVAILGSAFGISLALIAPVGTEQHQSSIHPNKVSLDLMLWATAAAYSALYYAAAKTASWATDIPELSEWYEAQPAVVRKLIRKEVSTSPNYPSITWRSFADLSREINSAGVSAAFISNQVPHPMWRQKTNWITWLMAPAIVPLATLVTIPMIYGNFQSLGFGCLPSKLQFAASILIWSIWAARWFQFEGCRNFSQPETSSSGKQAITLTQAISRIQVDQRKIWKSYFLGQGLVIVQLVALAIAPAYMGYIDLYDCDAQHECPSNCETQVNRPVMHEKKN